MLKSSLRVCLTAMVLLSTPLAVSAAPPQQKLAGSPAQFANNKEVLISYQAGKADAAKIAAETAGFEVIETYEPGKFIRCRPKASALSVADRANKMAVNDTVRFVEPNFVVSIPEPAGPPRPRPANAAVANTAVAAAAGKTPNDTMFSKLWGMANANAPKAWQTVSASDVVVGVIDSGVDYTHEDLVDNMWANPAETPGNGLDDDGNGLIDDVHGAKFENSLGSGNPMDDNSHGTHCAGSIGAVGDNSKGVSGVNWKIKIMALKFLDSGGSGSTNDAIRCIDYAVAQKNAGVNIRVLSNSWGGGGFSNALKEAIERANAAGILFVAAAGNESNDNDANPSYPANYDVANVISVASINRRDGLSWYSNFGTTTVDLAAPGGTLEGVKDDDIWSTVPKNLDTDGVQDGYSAFAGTSMATPHVSGAIALAWASPAHSGKLPADIKQLILNNTRVLPALAGKCVTGGTLNLEFLNAGSTPITIGPFVFAGGNDSAAGAFAINGETGTASYILGGSAYQSKLKFLEQGTAPDGKAGWIFTEDYPNFPFDFLLTLDSDPVTQKYSVYTRPAEDRTAAFSVLFNGLRGDEVTVNAVGDLRAKKMKSLMDYKSLMEKSKR